MDVTAQEVARSDRLDPLGFPSKIDVRFVLFIVAVLASSLIIYHLLSLQTHFQDFLDAASCALRQQPVLKQALSAQGLSAFQTAAVTVEQCGLPTQRIETDYMIGGDVLVVAVAVLIYWFYPAYLLRRRKLVHGRLNSSVVKWSRVCPDRSI